MLSVYCSTEGNSPVGAAARLPGYLKSSRFKDCIRKSWLPVVLCLLLLFSAAAFSVPQTVKADDGGYLLDKVIEWSDGSTEHVQMGKDGFFRLDGVKKRLVAMMLNTTWMPHGESGEFYLPENMALYDKELTYLESVGIRLIHVDMRYMRWWAPSIEDEEAAYTGLLDLVYQHKMLVIPMFAAKWMPGFSNLENPDFSWTVRGQIDSMGAWVTRWVDIVSRYPNVVAVVADNELDFRLPAEMLWYLPDPQDQEYTPSDVANYLDYLVSIIRSRTDAPIVSKLCLGLWWDQVDIKEVVLDRTDIPAFDCYDPTVQELDVRLSELLQWLSQKGLPTTGWWCTELNCATRSPGNLSTDDFTTGYIESVFNHGATVATLFVANWSTQPTSQFFDDNGAPMPKLVEIASEFDRLQAPIDTMLAQE